MQVVFNNRFFQFSSRCSAEEHQWRDSLHGTSKFCHVVFFLGSLYLLRMSQALAH